MKASKHKDRTELIEKKLRKDIVNGKFLPSKKIPTLRDFSDRYQASSATITKVFGNMMEKGFICTRGRSGTYVVDYPPHLYRYGLPFSYKEKPERF